MGSDKKWVRYIRVRGDLDATLMIANVPIATITSDDWVLDMSEFLSDIYDTELELKNKILYPNEEDIWEFLMVRKLTIGELFIMMINAIPCYLSGDEFPMGGKPDTKQWTMLHLERCRDHISVTSANAIISTY